MIDLLLATVDAVANDPTTDVITKAIGVLLTALTGLTGVQTAQMSGIRHDLQAQRVEQEKRFRKIEDDIAEVVDRVELLEPEEPPRRRQPKTTGSHTQTRGKKPPR